MRLKIFTVHHFMPTQWVANDIFAPFVTGMSTASNPALISDEGGDNIAHENSYGEMRAHYYVWKNLLSDYDYVGFQHYRRNFFFDQIPAASRDQLLTVLHRFVLQDHRLNFIDINPEAFGLYQRFFQQCDVTDIESIKGFVGRHDIIAVRPMHTLLKEQYAQGHVSADWDTLARLLPQHSRFQRIPQQFTFDLQALYVCNMFIMSAAEFNEYMTFWWEFMTAFAKEVKPHADPYQSRVYGFISERIFSFYLFQRRMELPTLRFAELPVITCGTMKA